MVRGPSGAIGRADKAGMCCNVMEGLERMELRVVNGMAESLWVIIKGQTNNMDVTVGVYYRPPSQDNDAKELFLEELRDTSKSTAVVLMRDFSLLEIDSEHHSWHKQFQKIPKTPG